MAKILDNISILAEKEGVTIGALERQIGASKGVLSRAIANGTDIQAKWIQAIVENYPHFSAQWLLTGEGPMLKTDTSAADGRHTTAPEAPAQYVTQLLNTIRELSEQIGRLKARIEELERRRGDNAGRAQSSDIANVG